MDGNSFRCVTAPEQLQDIKIPPGLTHRMARAFNPMYFKRDLDKDLTVARTWEDRARERRIGGCWRCSRRGSRRRRREQS